MAQTTLLIVDDDVEIRELLGQFLSKYDYNVLLAQDGIEMFEHFEAQAIDLIILDIMMPGDDGLTLCQKLRTRTNTPILMLSAVNEETDRIVGLEMGADDYLAKPFNPRELLARIKAILRRSESGEARTDEAGELVRTQQQCFTFAGWTLNQATRMLESPDELEVDLSAGEFTLLNAFLTSPEQILSRDQLLEHTHNRSCGPFDRSIDVQVSRLRQKLEDDPKNPKIIKTVRGGGYMFSTPVKKIRV